MIHLIQYVIHQHTVISRFISVIIQIASGISYRNSSRSIIGIFIRSYRSVRMIGLRKCASYLESKRNVFVQLSINLGQHVITLQALAYGNTLVICKTYRQIIIAAVVTTSNRNRMLLCKCRTEKQIVPICIQFFQSLYLTQELTIRNIFIP